MGVKKWKRNLPWSMSFAMLRERRMEPLMDMRRMMRFWHPPAADGLSSFDLPYGELSARP